MLKPEPLAAGVCWTYVLLVPAALLLTVYLLGGARYETNDDLTLRLLLQGITAARPLNDLHLYYLGWAHLTSALYKWQPALPWYDLLYVGWLYVALAGVFYVLVVVSPAGRRSWYGVLLGVGLVISSYALHLLQANFTRPAMLLSGVGAGLLALPVTSRSILLKRWLVAGLLFAAGWGIRPAAAELGVLLLLPVWLLQPVRHWGAALLWLGILGGGLTLATWLRTTPAEAHYAWLNNLHASTTDYKYYVFDLRTPTDSLAYATFEQGNGPYDASLVSDDFLRRCLRVASTPTTTEVLHRAKGAAYWLVKEWQPLAIMLLVGQWGAVGWATWQGRLQRRDYRLWLFAGYQAFFVILYVGVGTYFKAASRVAQPMISLFLLGNFIVLAGLGSLTLLQIPLRARWGTAIAGIALLLTLSDERQLIQKGRALEQERAVYLQQLTQQAAGTILVEGGLYDMFDNVELFQPYGLPRYRRIISLGGWSSLHPSQPALYYYLTGQRSIPAALQQLGQRPDVTWVLKPAFAALLEKYLNARCSHPATRVIKLVPVTGSSLPGGPQLYAFHESVVMPAARSVR